MSLYRNMLKIVGVVVVGLIIISSGVAIAHEIFIQQNPSLSGEKYEGRLRVYVVEPVSRWKDCNGNLFHFGFLDFAANTSLSIDYQDTYSGTFTWDANQAGFNDVGENNIMVIAAVYNATKHEGIIDLPPPYEDIPFDAYYADVAAAATPGHTGYNTVNENFTHTVFCEEATGHFCHACPPAAEALRAIYESGDYPFYYTALICDENDKTLPRLFEYFTTHEIGVPTCFFDGGFRVDVGGGEGCEARYRETIEACGKRASHELDLLVSLKWLGNGAIQVDVRITNDKIHHDPLIEIGEISVGSRGFGRGGWISAEIINNGTGDATKVNWSISIIGGLLGKINVHDVGTIPTLDIGNLLPIKTTTPVRGLGKVKITITADQAKRTIDGFVLGPFIILR